MANKKRASIEENNPLNKMFQRSGPRDDQEPETTEDKPNKAKRTKRRDPTHKQTTIIFLEDQLDWLDYVSYDSRKGSGKVVSKSELIREVVNILREHDLNLRGVRTSQDIQKRLRETLNIE